MNSKFRSLNRKNRVLRQFLITYVIVFIVPLLICSIYFFQVIRMLGKDDLNFRQAELEHAADQIDNMLEEFENMGDILTANAYVNAFKHRTEDVWSSPNSYRLNELRDSLPQILLMNQNVFHYFIFFDKSNLVINDRDIYTWEVFFDLYLRVDQEITYVSAMCLPLLLLILVIQKSRNLLAVSRITLEGMPAIKCINGVFFLILSWMLVRSL